MYIADLFNFRIRKVTISTGFITTIAGTGANSYNGDGVSATSAALNYASEVVIDTSGTVLFIYLHSYWYDSALNLAGNFYIADYGNNRIRKVTISTGIISTFAGTGSTGYSGDNAAATSADLYFPQSVALDASGKQLV